jgi:hypothetical protein
VTGVQTCALPIFGVTSLNEIKTRLAEHGLKLVTKEEK